MLFLSSVVCVLILLAEFVKGKTFLIVIKSKSSICFLCVILWRHIYVTCAQPKVTIFSPIFYPKLIALCFHFKPMVHAGWVFASGASYASLCLFVCLLQWISNWSSALLWNACPFSCSAYTLTSFSMNEKDKSYALDFIF